MFLVFLVYILDDLGASVCGCFWDIMLLVLLLWCFDFGIGFYDAGIFVQ